MSPHWVAPVVRLTFRTNVYERTKLAPWPQPVALSASPIPAKRVLKIRGWRFQLYAVPRDELALIIRQPRLGLFGISRSPRRRLPLRSRPHGQRPSAIGNHPPRCQTEPGSDLEVGWRLLWSCLLPDSLGGSRVCPWARLTRAAASDQLLAGDRQRPQLARSSQSHTS